MQDLQVAAGVAGRYLQPAAPQDAAFEVGHGALFLGPLRHRQHHVGQLRGLRRHEVGDHQKVQRGQPVHDVAGVGRRNHRIGTEDQQGPGALGGTQRVEQFVGAAARTRQHVGQHAPGLGHVRPRGRIGDHPVTGQLVGFLAVLAPALPVALPRQASVAASGAARQAERQGEVDESGHGVDALAVLLGTATGEHISTTGLGKHPNRLPLGGHRNPGDALDALRPPGHRPLPGRVETRGAGPDVVGVGPAVDHRDVQQPEHQRQVCAGRGL